MITSIAFGFGLAMLIMLSAHLPSQQIIPRIQKQRTLRDTFLDAANDALESLQAQVVESIALQAPPGRQYSSKIFDLGPYDHRSLPPNWQELLAKRYPG